MTHVDGPSPEDLKRAREFNLRQAERAHNANDEFFHRANEAAVKSAEAAVRIALLINGGAAVSLLAFIGGLAAQGKVKTSELGPVFS
jgi:hypothetical protein